MNCLPSRLKGEAHAIIARHHRLYGKAPSARYIRATLVDRRNREETDKTANYGKQRESKAGRLTTKIRLKTWLLASGKAPGNEKGSHSPEALHPLLAAYRSVNEAGTRVPRTTFRIRMSKKARLRARRQATGNNSQPLKTTANSPQG